MNAYTAAALAETHRGRACDGPSEWYSPPELVAAAVAVMGGVDLDPASTPVANEVVGAAAFHTAETDGLTQPWAGRVWMCPPHTRQLIRPFCDGLAAAYTAGHVTEGCALVNNATDTRWFHALAGPASAVCFLRGRVRFWRPGATAVPVQGQAVVYLGPRPRVFRDVFASLGVTGGVAA